jgi:hypothetical protein
VSASVENTRSEVCWAAVSRDGRFAYVTNFGDSTISSYAIGADGSIELLDPVAAFTRRGEKGIRDEAITTDGRYLYALDADGGTIHGWMIDAGGALTPRSVRRRTPSNRRRPSRPVTTTGAGSFRSLSLVRPAASWFGGVRGDPLTRAELRPGASAIPPSPSTSASRSCRT